MIGTDLYPIKQDQYSGRLEMVYTAVMPKPGYHFEYNNGIRTQVINAINTKSEIEPIQARILPVEMPNVIIVPEILLPILQPTVKNDTFEEILEAETEGIKTGIGKGIITGVIVGIILMMVMRK